MSDPAGSPADEPADVDAADAFSTLGHPLRLEIVTALHEHSGDSPLAFSSLYEQVDAEDTASFNYHRDRLVPHFVSKTADGYELTAAGERIARAVTAGTYTDAPRVEPFDLDGRCYRCGAAALRGSYEDERFRVDCLDCDGTVVAVAVPPSLVRGREAGAFADAFDRWARFQVEQARQGICPDCGGAVEPSVVENTHDTISFDHLARFECTVCGRTVVTSFGALAAEESAVKAFHRRRGDSLESRPYWEIPQYVSAEHVDVVSRNPRLFRVTFVSDGDACLVDVDGNLDVVGVDVVADGSHATDGCNDADGGRRATDGCNEATDSHATDGGNDDASGRRGDGDG